MADFAPFDTRGYRTVDVRSGYGEWVATYEQTVQDAMDAALLESLRTVDWGQAGTVADLGCGAGRTGAWLREHGAGAIDGVDLTPEMLERARARGVHRRLLEGDVAATGLEAGAYDLVICSLVDEHLATLGPLSTTRGSSWSRSGPRCAGSRSRSASPRPSAPRRCRCRASPTRRCPRGR